MKTTARAAPRSLCLLTDGGLVSQAGALLLAETLRVTGLGEGLSAGLARWRAPRAVHDPGRSWRTWGRLALGGDCLADIAVLRGRAGAGRPGGSDPVVSRLVSGWPRMGRGRCGRSAKPGPLPGSGLGAGRRAAPGAAGG